MKKVNEISEDVGLFNGAGGVGKTTIAIGLINNIANQGVSAQIISHEKSAPILPFIFGKNVIDASQDVSKISHIINADQDFYINDYPGNSNDALKGLSIDFHTRLDENIQAGIRTTFIMPIVDMQKSFLSFKLMVDSFNDWSNQTFTDADETLTPRLVPVFNKGQIFALCKNNEFERDKIVAQLEKEVDALIEENKNNTKYKIIKKSLRFTRYNGEATSDMYLQAPTGEKRLFKSYSVASNYNIEDVISSFTNPSDSARLVMNLNNMNMDIYNTFKDLFHLPIKPPILGKWDGIKNQPMKFNTNK